MIYLNARNTFPSFKSEFVRDIIEPEKVEKLLNEECTPEERSAFNNELKKIEEGASELPKEGVIAMVIFPSPSGTKGGLSVHASAHYIPSPASDDDNIPDELHFGITPEGALKFAKDPKRAWPIKIAPTAEIFFNQIKSYLNIK